MAWPLDDLLGLGGLDLTGPTETIVQRLALGARGEDDLAVLFRRAGWLVIQIARAEHGAVHPPLWVRDEQLPLPDLMVRAPCGVWLFVEVKVKRKGPIQGVDAYGMNAEAEGRRCRWSELQRVEKHAGNAAIAFYCPRHGWQLATVAKLLALGIRRSDCGRWWLFPRRHLTPLGDLLSGVRLGLVAGGKAV